MRSTSTRLALLVVACITLSAAINAQVNDPRMRREDKHSFRAPFIATASGIPYWEIRGDTLVSEEYIRLTGDVKSSYGNLWNIDPVDFTNWEVILEFKISGSGRIGADGLAFWYVDLAHNADNHDTNVFGFKSIWRGLGVFFDTFDNDGNGDNPLISVVYNDGNQFFDNGKDGVNLRLGGCTSKIRNPSRNTRAKIRYNNQAVSVSLDTTGSGQFDECVKEIRLQLPENYNFGVTAGTGGLHDNHDVYSLTTYSLDAANNYRRYERQRQQQREREQQRELEQKIQQQQEQKTDTQDTQNQPPVQQFQQQAQQAQQNQPTPAPQQAQQQVKEQAQQYQQTQRENIPADEQVPSLIKKVDILKEMVHTLHNSVDESETKNTVEKVREQVHNVGQAVTLLATNVVTKKDFDAFRSASEQKQQQYHKELADLKMLISDMKAAVNQRINNNDQDISKTLQQLTQNVNGLKGMVELTSRDTQKISSTLQVNANEIASTIERQTTFGFWSYFLFVQAIFVFGFIFWKKYKDDSNKKLI